MRAALMNVFAELASIEHAPPTQVSELIEGASATHAHLTRALGLVALAVWPVLLPGLITKVKALWSGRRGAPVLQPLWDLRRLVRKTSVYSLVSTPVFRIGPWVALVTAVASAALVPLAGGPALASFPFDFVALASLWALGRVALMLAALDTGSSFEGMGAAREATFSTLVEPALFLLVGALALASGGHRLELALALRVDGVAAALVWAGALVGLVVVLQVEAARLPVDDPTTHLELTMVHEVMVLDHSGPELAAIQLGHGVKLTVGAAAVAALLNPWAGEGSVRSAAAHAGAMLLLAVGLGTVESLVARLKLRAVPQYIGVAIAAGVVALLATLGGLRGAP